MELPQRMKLQKMRQNRIAMQQITLQIIPELMKTTTVTAVENCAYGGKSEADSDGYTQDQEYEEGDK